MVIAMENAIDADLPDAVVFADLKAVACLDRVGRAAVTQGLACAPDVRVAAVPEGGGQVAGPPIRGGVG
jgi:hypothetical protein